MYEVSEAYMQAISSVSFREDLRGSIGNTAFGMENVLKGSFSISNQCCGSSSVEIGQVYIGELDCTFTGLSIQRKEYKDLVVVPRHGVWIPELGEFEYVPLGVYTIDKAEWTESGIAVTAYDNMAKFDKTFSITSTNGFIYDFLVYACSRCNVELGMTKAEIEDLPNGKENLDLFEEVNDIKTFRDFLSWIAQTTATNAFVDREGKLYLRTYDMNPVDTLDNYRRLRSGSISDFETYYTGMSVVNIEQKTTSYYAVLPDNGLTYNLGQNPLLQYGLDDTKTRQRRAILESLAVGRYSPCKFSLMQAPIYDLMDCVTLAGGIVGNEDTEITCVLKYDWKFGGTYAFECVGQDPSLASVQSKVDKNIAGLMEAVQNDNSTFYVYGFENSEAYSIGTEPEMVTRIDFATVDTSRVVFIYDANCEITRDGNVVADLYVDDDLVDTYTIYCSRGMANVMFSWFYDLTAGLRHELKILLHWEYFESDVRRNKAGIGTLKNYVDAVVFYMSRQAGTWAAISVLTWNAVGIYTWDDIYSEDSGIGYSTWDDVLKGGLKISPSEIRYTDEPIDTSAGLINIDVAKVKSVLFGRGLAATDVWDGTIKVSDSTEVIPIIKPTVIPVNDVALLETHIPIPHGLSDSLVNVSIPVMTILNVVHDAGINVSEKAESEDGTHVIVYCVNSNFESDVIYFDTDIVSITFNTTQGSTFAVSNDGGISWFTWDGEHFVQLASGATTYGAADVMSSVPADSWNAFEVNGIKFKWTEGDPEIIDTIEIVKVASEDEGE